MPTSKPTGIRPRAGRAPTGTPGGYVAFRGDPAVKAAAIEALDVPPAHGAGGTSIVDVDRCGFPACLPRLFDALQDRRRVENGDGRAAGPFVWAALKGTPVGADLSGVPSGIVLDALEDVRSSYLALPAGLAEAAASMEGLHRDHAAGDRAEPGRWRAARSSAVTATDGARTKLERSLGALVEAICWDPLESGVVLVDLARSFAQVRYDAAVVASGWTPQDQLEADAILSGLHAAAATRRDAGERIDLKAMFSSRHRELERRYGLQLKMGVEAYRSAWWRLGDICLDRLAAAR